MGVQMKIYDIDFGFVEIPENSIVEKIICKYDGICTIYFYDRPSKKLSVGCSPYNYQYGIPLSEDSTKLFVGSWEKGIYTYDVNTGELLWKYKQGRIRNIFVYSNFLIALRANNSIVKLDIETGELLAIVKSGTLEHIFDLSLPYIFADTISGRHCVIDVKNMIVVKKYTSKIVNPFNCLSLMIRNVTLQHKEITIYGIEEYPQKIFDSKTLVGGTQFIRKIDNNFDMS